MKNFCQNYTVYFMCLLFTLFLSTPSFAVDSYKLSSGQWRLISLPEDPGNNNTVSKLFEDDMTADGKNPKSYGEDWAVFSYAYDAKTNDYRYVTLKLNDILQPGIGYWIIQMTGNLIQLDMPSGSVEISKPFTTPLNPPAAGGKHRWNLLGHPSAESTKFSRYVIKTSSGDCSKQQCSPETAKQKNIFHNQIWRYEDRNDDGNGSYQAVAGDTLLNPWDGFWGATLTESINRKPQLVIQDNTPQLLFSSGFEGGVKLGPFDGYYQYILGTDSETGYSWPIDILGSSGSGLHLIDHDNGAALENEIQTVTGHDGSPTKALYNIQHYGDGVTQSPYEILDMTEGTKDVYIRYWIKMDSASLTVPNMWRTFFEYKTKDYAKRTGFRLIAFIYTDNDGAPFWVWQGDKHHSEPIWEFENKSVPVPLNEWFLTEFYWHWSDGDDGRALWKVNGQVIKDHYGPTTQNSKPVDFIMMTQIYGNANPKHQWIDDIEIWDGIPE
jgi:hypothetical protein